MSINIIFSLMPKLQKTLLKEKLLNYQKEIQDQANPKIDLQNFISQRSDEYYQSLRKTNQVDHMKNNYSTVQHENNQDYLKYLSQFTFKGQNSYKSELTRQNIQTMNKKTRLIRSSYYQSPHNFQLAIKISNSPYKDLIHKELTFRSKKSISYQNSQKKTPLLYKSTKIFQSNSSFLMIKKSKCQTIEHPYQYMKRSESFHTPNRKLSRQMNRAKTALQKRKQQKISLKTVTKQQNSIQKNETSSKEMGLIMNQFKPKLKSKYLQDNIKVMANIMKRKIGIMNGQQIYQYVNKISNKRQPLHIANERDCQKKKNQYRKK